MATSLLADIGGTNIRFGLLKGDKVEHLVVYPHEKGLTAEKAIQRYLSETRVKPSTFIAGVAGILTSNGRISLTNRRFTINMPLLRRKFGFKKALLANDMIFHALGVLGQPDTRRACIIFVGTGLGVSFLNQGVAHTTETGHEPLIRPTKEEKELGAQIWEDIISGPSFLRIYRNLQGTYKPVMQSREVSYLAHNVHDRHAIWTYKIMAKCLARLCIHIAQTQKVSVFFFGGLLTEILRLPLGQDVFFQALGRWADIMGIRIIRTSEQTAMKGLKLIADDLKATGTTSHINPGECFLIK